MFDDSVSCSRTIMLGTQGAWPAPPVSRGVKFSNEESKRLPKDGASARGFVTQAILRAANIVRPKPCVHQRDHRRYLRSATVRHTSYALAPDEWAAVMVACHGRDWRKWEREVIRTALGFKHHVWTPCADAFLRLNYRRLPPETLLRALPGRTEYAITTRALHLGLTGKCDDRFMTLREVARVVGYDPKAVAKMANPARVVLTRRVPRVLYRVDDVKRAVVGRGDPVYVVAKRLKMRASTARTALVAMGIPRPPRQRAWRISDEVVAQLKERVSR